MNEGVPKWNEEDDMMTRRFSIILLISALVLPALASLLSAHAQEGPPQVGLRPDAPPYALHGPYWVGARDFRIEEGREVPLKVHAWYPALNPTGALEEITYKAILKDDLLPDVGPVVDMYGHALQDADVDLAAAPYPLVVFSHGFGTPAHDYAHLVEHYASYGFIVLAPEHQERFDFEFTYLIPATIARPQDIAQVLDLAEELTAGGGAMDGMIDTEHVAVVGHSFGGYTTLAAAGARYDMEAFTNRCSAGIAQGDPVAEWICDPLGLETGPAALAAEAGLDPIPTGLWPSYGDARVDAIVPMAGDAYMYGQAGLAEITIPVMAMGGTLDSSTPYEWATHPTYQDVSSARKALVAFENAEHLIFATTVEDAPFLQGTMWETYYMDAVWDKARAHDLIHHLSTAFLLATLKDDAEAAAALAPDAVAFPGITYEAQGF